MVIHLGHELPHASSGLPEGKRATYTLLFSLAPDGVYLANHVTAVAGGLLHHRFTLTRSNNQMVEQNRPIIQPGGFLSVATIP